jgi:hypothetical protein
MKASMKPSEFTKALASLTAIDAPANNPAPQTGSVEIKNKPKRPRREEPPDNKNFDKTFALRVNTKQFDDFQQCCYRYKKFPAQVLRQFMDGYVDAWVNGQSKG